MPYSTRRRVNNKKNAKSRRTYRKQYRKYPISNRLSSVVPNAITIPFKVTSSHAMSPGVAAFGSRLFAANGLYDTDITGTGQTQPLGFDQYVGVLFEHYTVIGSRLKLQCFNNSNSEAAIIGVRLSADNTTYSTGAINMQQNRSKYIILGDNDSEPRTLTMNFSPKKFFGKKDIVGSGDFKGSATANPTELGYYIVYVGPVDPIGTVNEAQFVVTIEYLAVLTEPKILAISS